MTRLGLVLNDSVLLSRVAADFDHTIRNPINFHNTCVFCPFFFLSSFLGLFLWLRSLLTKGSATS